MTDAAADWLNKHYEIDFKSFDDDDEEDDDEDIDLGFAKKEPSVDELIEEFTFKIRPTEVHRRILFHAQQYEIHNDKYMRKKNRAAGRRARKHLLALFHLARARRLEILDRIKSLKPGEWR